MKVYQKFKILILFLGALVIFYTLLLTFGNDNFDKLLQNEPHYIAYFLDLENITDVHLTFNEALKKDFDIYIIKSKEPLKINDTSFHIFRQKLTSYLTVLSKFKLGKNKVILNNNFFNPVYTGFIKFPKKRVLISFLSTGNLPTASESEDFRKYLMIRRNFTEFRHKKLPILFLANWDINFLTLTRWLHYLQIKPVNKLYDFSIKSDDIQVFKNNSMLKIFDVKKDGVGVKIAFSI